MGKIALEGMRFFAHHGHYEKEREAGNWFEVDVWLETDFTKAAASDDLGDALNYEEVYHLVQVRMQTPANLLEQLATDIHIAIRGAFPEITRLSVRVSKNNPPLAGEVARSYAEVNWPQDNVKSWT